ncbi:MAG: VanW family protein [Beutenbergiaceae bacterium]
MIFRRSSGVTEGADPPSVTASPDAGEDTDNAATTAALPALDGPAAEPDEQATEPDQQATEPETQAALSEITGAAADPAEEPDEPTEKPRRSRKLLIGVGIGLVVLAGGYFGAAWYFSDRVPPETTVAGVDLSGLSSATAQQVLADELADRVVEPIPVSMGDLETTIDPEVAGLALDVEATVDSFTGFRIAPQALWGHIVGIGAQDPVTDADADALNDALTTVAAELDVPPVDGVIEFVDGEASITVEPADGLGVDLDAAADELTQTWLTSERPLTLPTQVTAPVVDENAIDAAMADIVEPLLSGPVTVGLNDVEASLEPAQLAAVASLVPGDSGLELVLDGEALAAAVSELAPSVGETATDAQIVLQDGAPTIIPAVTGTGLQPDQLAEVVGAAAVATAPQDRVAVAELAETEAEFSTADAEALGVSEIISEFSTPYPYDPPRTANLVNGAAHISGTLILPGETFSLIEALGPITPANGYRYSHVVVNGKVEEALGGGLSQISTTTFNAAFEAGMEDIIHKPHSRYFDRYPAGREATMFTPSLDMQWGNNTPYGVMVQAWVADGRVHVRLWGTKYWDVEIVSSSRYGFTSPRTITESGADCTPQSAGPGGFSIDISRTVALDGEVNATYSKDYSWTYAPVHRIVCEAPDEGG